MTDEKKSSLSAEKEFKVLIERKILIQENCYLLIDLVEQMAKLYEIYSVKEKVGDKKKTKFFLLTNFQDSLLFTPGHGIPIIAYSVEIKPIDYAMSSIIESWLKKWRDHPNFFKNDKSWAKVSRTFRKLSFIHKKSNEGARYDQIKDIFNAVSLSCNPNLPINDFGDASPVVM